METVLKFVQKLTKRDLKTKTVWHILASTTEELGELSREMLIEDQITGNTYKKTDEGSIMEAIDLIICSFSLYFSRGGKLKNIPELMHKKLKKWEQKGKAND